MRAPRGVAGPFLMAHHWRFPRVSAVADKQWTDDDELRLVMMLGLRKGLALVGGARRTFNEEEQKRIARAILDHLRLSNYTIAQGQPAYGHAALMPSRRVTPDPDEHD